MSWRRLRPGELDHEALWLGVSLASVASAWLWLRLGLPLMRCTFHEVTGCACPTCGATRCVRFALGGDFAAAFQMNPLAFLAFIGVPIFNAYALAVLALRLPRWRADAVPPRVASLTRFTAIAAILLNWAWLLWSGV